MSAETDIYDFEGIFSTAFSSFLDSLDLKNMSQNTAQQLQEDRPRFNVIVSAELDGDMLLPEAGVQVAPGHSRITTGTGSLSLELITDSDIELQRVYRSRIRNEMATCCRGTTINETYLTHHRLNWIKPTKPSYEIDASKGDYKTTHNYDFGFSVQANAWAALG